MRDAHVALGWALVISNGLVGGWALGAHLEPRLRHRWNALAAGLACGGMRDLCSFLSCYTGILGTGGGILMGSAVSGLVWKATVLLISLSIRPSHC